MKNLHFANDQYENNENACINCEDFIIPNHHISIQPGEAKLK